MIEASVVAVPCFAVHPVLDRHRILLVRLDENDCGVSNIASELARLFFVWHCSTATRSGISCLSGGIEKGSIRFKVMALMF